MSTTMSEALTIMGGLEPPVLEIVLDQVRIAYRAQEAVKESINQRAQQTAQQTQQTEGE